MKRLSLTIASALVVALAVPMATASVAANAALPACAHLIVGVTEVNGAAGTEGATFLLANAGPRCSLEGFPTVVFYGAHGNPVDPIDVHRASTFFAEPPAKLLVLAHSSVASVGVSWSDTPTSKSSCPPATSAKIVLPNGVGVIDAQPSIIAAPCGGKLFVTPIEAGAEPIFAGG